MKHMKKILACLLIACMLFAFAACGDTVEPIVGEWSAAGVVIGGKVVPLIMNDKASSLYLGRNFTAGEDGSFMLQSGSQAHVGKWKEEDKTVVRNTWTLKRKDTYGYSEDTTVKAPSEFTVWTGASEPDVLYFADTATGENITVVFVRKGDTGRFTAESSSETAADTTTADTSADTSAAADTADTASAATEAAAPADSGSASVSEAPAATEAPATEAPAESSGDSGSILDSILGMIPGLDSLDLGSLLGDFDIGSLLGDFDLSSITDLFSGLLG